LTLLHFVVPAMMLAGTITAQEPPASREEELACAQSEKAAKVAAPVITRDEELFRRYVSKPLGSFFTPKVGWTVRLGGLMSGSGFGLGPLYSRPDLLGEKLDFKFSLAGSLNQYWAASTLLSLPHLAGDRLRADFYARHSDANSIDYYGSGPNSRKEDRTNYRQEDSSFDGRFSWRPDRRKTSLGFYGGFLGVNVGPGTSGDGPSSEKVFTASQAPGIHQQTSFVRYGPYIEYNNLDKPGDPHRGGNYEARFLLFDDVNVNRYAFRRFDGWTEQYIPFFNEKRVIALHASTNLTWTKPGQLVPFYLQPTLGDSHDLRGYARFRYRDNNSVALSGEYRWEVMPGFDMALFLDAGKVFPKASDLSLNNLRYSGGFGFRFKTRDAVVMRVDTGFSREGFSLWFKFSDVYSRDLFRYLF